MLRVGLTGGIACGKSHVLTRLAARGFHVLDLDRLAHQAMAPGGAAYDAIALGFGRRVLAPDGRIDRKALGAMVFGDPAALEWLNAVVHPLVREEESRRVAAWAGNRDAVVVSDAALLVEAGVHLRFDRLVVVHCRPEQQLERLISRDGIDEAAARARIASQMPLSEKRRYAHFDLDTSGSHDDTARAAERIGGELEALAAARPPRARLPLERALGTLVHGPPHGPRGLSAASVLEEISRTSGLEMAPLARRLVPPAQGAWYQAAQPDDPGPGPECLAAAAVLWSLLRGAPDPAFVFAAVASLARLTHRADAAVASACLFGRALLEVAVLGHVPADLPARAARWSPEAMRWGGAAPAPTLVPVFEAAARHAEDIAAAREESARRSGSVDLAGALVGLSVGAAIERAAPAVVEALRRLSNACAGGRAPAS